MSGRISSSPATIGSTGWADSSPARRRRTAASTRASTSSGWQGFVTQSSAPEPQPAHALGDRARAGADHDRGRGRLAAELLEIGPRLAAQQRRVDHDRVQPHALELLDRRRAGQQLRPPADRAEPLREHAHEAAVGVDDGQPHGGRRGGRRAPGDWSGDSSAFERFH